ncbi:hypothetical protein [Bradyrhizobium sp. SZCCHNRI3052]|uniref:hypothetical protein n=1 Tax=Bradyrhizobium sp. SZCCHNRI3052 TaxID=3057295 RepID=UPI002916F22A|nr:hypothetical protein [Bradyrhizobium sp. SZCCHNRI3052]
MSLEKAQQLLELATFVPFRCLGVTLNEIGDRLDISKRAAQRILHTLEVQFPDTQATFDDNGHKRWRLRTGAPRDLVTLAPDELAALDLSIMTLERNSLDVKADQLAPLYVGRSGDVSAPWHCENCSSIQQIDFPALK